MCKQQEKEELKVLVARGRGDVSGEIVISHEGFLLKIFCICVFYCCGSKFSMVKYFSHQYIVDSLALDHHH